MQALGLIANLVVDIAVVEQALATIESCPMVLPLLNKATRSEVGAYYGYYGLEKS